MKVVYSYWETGDGLKKPGNWLNSRFMLSSIVISVLNSYKHYGRVEMVTDTRSKLWVEKLGLPFESIKTDLDELDRYHKNSWALGKIKAYSIQNEPFMHVDLDVILYEALSDKLVSNELYVQNLEPFTTAPYNKTYLPYIDLLKKHGENLPIGFYDTKHAFNLGIYGCNNINFNNLFCDSVFKFINNNEKIFKTRVPLDKLCVIWEQYFCAVIADKMGLSIGTVIDPYYESPTESGYTHLLINKYNEKVAENFNEHVKIIYPKYYKSINELLKK